MKKLNTVAALMLVIAVPAWAGQSQATGSGTATSVQGRAAQQTPPPRATTTTQPGQGRGFGRGPAQAVNVRLDITINDQSSSGQPVRKSMSVLVADDASASVRSSGMVHRQVQRGLGPDGNPSMGLEPLFEVELNVDAAVNLLEADKIRTRITLEYTPGSGTPVPQNQVIRPSPLHETVTVILQNGRPLVITQAADPLSDRKITVEVTGTILR